MRHRHARRRHWLSHELCESRIRSSHHNGQMTDYQVRSYVESSIESTGNMGMPWGSGDPGGIRKPSSTGGFRVPASEGPCSRRSRASTSPTDPLDVARPTSSAIARVVVRTLVPIGAYNDARPDRTLASNVENTYGRPRTLLVSNLDSPVRIPVVASTF